MISLIFPLSMLYSRLGSNPMAADVGDPASESAWRNFRPVCDGQLFHCFCADQPLHGGSGKFHAIMDNIANKAKLKRKLFI